MSSKGGDVLRDLYRDLRDRRLLPVVIVLAVAIVAVPFLLGGGSDPAPPSSPAGAEAGVSVDSTDPLSPVVLTDVPGLRDYRQRLSRFNSRDPFKQQLTGEKTAQGGAGNLAQVNGTGSTSSVSSSSSGGSTATSSSTSTNTTSTTSTGGGTPPADPGNSGSNGGRHGGRGEDRIVKITIDVRVGRAGKAKVLKGVESLAFLPGDERPVVQFVEGDKDATHAAFVLSPAVTSTEGDGRCDPGRNDCQFLLMQEGDVRTFVYGDKQETYRLELLAIHRTTVPVSSAGG